jgi:hypothetical protein
MSSRSASAAPDELPARPGAGPVAWLALLCSLAALGLGVVAFVRSGGHGTGGGSGPVDLDDRLNAHASALRGELRRDIDAGVADARAALTRAEHTLHVSEEQITKKVDDTRRVADNAARTFEEAAGAVDGKLSEVAATTGTLRNEVDELKDSVKTIESRRFVAAPAPAPSAKANGGADSSKPSDKPADPAPAPSGPSPEAIAANKKKVETLVADLSSPDFSKAYAACAGLGTLGDLAAVEPLTKTLKDHKNDMVRGGAASALGTLRACDAVPNLLQAFLDRSDEVVLAAGVAFRKIVGQDSGLTGSPTRRERNDAHDKWTKWWAEHEKEVRARLGQPKAGEEPK